jgi:hypothetical protein
MSKPSVFFPYPPAHISYASVTFGSAPVGVGNKVGERCNLLRVGDKAVFEKELAQRGV